MMPSQRPLTDPAPGIGTPAHRRPLARALGIAAVSLVLLLSAYPSPASAQGESDQAERLFQQGVSLAKEGKYAEAAEAFGKSYALDPTRGTLLGLAMSKERSGALVEAHALYRQLVHRSIAERDDERQKQAVAAMIEIEPQVARIVLVSGAGLPANATITLDGKPVDRMSVGEAIAVSPGSHVVEVTAEGFQDYRSEVDVQDRSLLRVEVTMLPVPAVSPPPREPVAVASGSDGLRTAAYVAGGLGILGLAGGTYAWSRAKSTYSDLQDRCPNNVCDPSLRSTADEGRSYDRWALIGFVTGGVGLAAGVTMFVLSVDGDAPPDEQGATNLAIGPGSVAVQGRF